MDALPPAAAIPPLIMLRSILPYSLVAIIALFAGHPVATQADALDKVGDSDDSAARTAPVLENEAPTQHEIVPILLLRCTACHGAEVQRLGLDLRTTDSLRRGSTKGAVAVAGDPDASPMIQRIEQRQCPPSDQLLKYFVERPTRTEVARLRAWIAAGMPEVKLPEHLETGIPDPEVTEEDRQHWAFQPLPQQISVPRFAETELLQPIDAFIYRGLRNSGLRFSPPATRNELIRRVYLNLIGMPPTLEELERWEQFSGDDWYAEMVDHLLASPRYGERWGRYWLDVAGYADSEGGQTSDDVRQNAWKYRDYVIRSHNADKPWDRFLLEQLAGDELADYTDPNVVTDEVVDNLIATGFLRMTVDQTGSRTMNFVPERLGLIADALHVVSSGVMGLTMECARCHSHKYDPIPHGDYYRMKAIFQGAFDEHDWMSWKTRTLNVATPEMIVQHKSTNTTLERQIKELESRRNRLIGSWQDRYYDQQWPKLSAELQDEIEAALKAQATRRSLRQAELVARYESEIRPSESVLVSRHPDLADELKELDKQIAGARRRLVPPLTIRALWDRGRPSPTYILTRGEYNRPGEPVAPGVPSVLTDGKTPLDIQPPWPGAESTGRRLAFARWLIEPEHPLTARVLVNRVWSHHFGRGIVRTVDNFGRQGAEPTHRELLDWLARDFIESGWSLKSLHRKILLSRTYRQSSIRTDHQDQVDPENKLLSRMSLQRIDAEALRDSLLAISGQLDATPFGPPAPVSVRPDGLIMEQTSRTGQSRRSIYLQLRRTEMPTLLSAFDYPEMQPNCNERTVSTVATQSLILLNNERIHQLAEKFAERILEDADTDRQQLVQLAYRSAFSRPAAPDEEQEGAAALGELERAWRRTGAAEDIARRRAVATFCHTILNSAEFMYID